MKIGAIIQARTSSSRLPNKVLMDVEGKTILEHVVERLKSSKYLDYIIVATTDKACDDAIVNLCEDKKILCFRGNEEDVLSRYYFCSTEYKIDTVVRITSDCPLIDSIILDEVLNIYINNNYSLVTNAGRDFNQTFPRGLDVEVFSFEVLKNTYINAKKNYQKEHVTPYIYENDLNVYYYKNKEDYSYIRLTLDTKEDLMLIKEIFKGLYKEKHNFYMNDIINYINENRHLLDINAHINQKNIEN